MKYNLSYEICALFILFLVFIHVNGKLVINSFRNRFFRIFIVIGSFDIIFDILTGFMFSYPELYPAWIQSTATTIFYLLQVSLTYMFYMYCYTLNDRLHVKNAREILACSILFFVMIGLVFSNPSTGYIFYFDSNDVYTYGPLYYATYIYALIYMLMTVSYLLIFHKSIQKKQFWFMLECILWIFLCTGIQAIQSEVLLTGVGISVSLIIIILTLNNPIEQMDAVTKVFDRNGLREFLTDAYSRRNDLHLIIVSIEGLKQINSLFGMETGDYVLREFAKYLVRLHSTDYVYRFMANSFVIVRPDLESIQHTYESMVDWQNKNVEIKGTKLNTQVYSILIENIFQYGNVEEAFSFIDFVMRKKNSNYIVSQLDLEEYNRSRMIETFLYEAVEKNLFTLKYQPLYNVEFKKFRSLEALCRLNHPVLGEVLPSEFIPLAEKNNLISEVGRLNFVSLCKFIQKYQSDMPTIISVKVNLSPIELLNPDLPSFLKNCIEEYRLKPEFFQFEITETVATRYYDEVIEVTGKLKEIGFELCLDDFGSGFANMAAIMKLPFDVVKIDRSLILDIHNNEKSKEFYRYIVNMLKGLGYLIVSEGAERKEDVDFLLDFDINAIQGYYYSKPLPIDELLKLLKENS